MKSVTEIDEEDYHRLVNLFMVRVLNKKYVLLPHQNLFACPAVVCLKKSFGGEVVSLYVHFPHKDDNIMFYRRRIEMIIQMIGDGYGFHVDGVVIRWGPVEEIIQEMDRWTYVEMSKNVAW